MRSRRLKLKGERAIYHCMSRTVNKERLFGRREREVLRKMIWRVADFSGVGVLTYCVMDNHFHVLVEVPESGPVSDVELMRRYRVLYPKTTEYQEASVSEMERILSMGGKDAEAIRRRLVSRMGDVSEYMKTLKQRFSVWFNGTHGRCGTLWSERFKSVLVEGRGNPLQTMAAYIDLNPVRAGLVADPKDYRFCGYAEAVAGRCPAVDGLKAVWADYADGSRHDGITPHEALRAHRMLLFGKGSDAGKGIMIDRDAAVRVLEDEQGVLPKAVVLRCRVRYFSDGGILGSAGFVHSFVQIWTKERGRRSPPKVSRLRGAEWGDLAAIQGLRRQIFF